LFASDCDLRADNFTGTNNRRQSIGLRIGNLSVLFLCVIPAAPWEKGARRRQHLVSAAIRGDGCDIWS
jgi:hypothetical protein